MKSFTIVALLTVTICPMVGHAQTPGDTAQVQRTVVVEQEYNPHIGTARRINALPTVTPPSQERTEVEYVESAIPATTIPADSMQAMGPAPKADTPGRPGYVRLGAGIGGRLDGKAHYRFTLTPRDHLAVGLDFDGRQSDVDFINADDDWESRYFQTRFGLGYTHEGAHTSLDLSGHLGLSNFNYLPDAVSGRQKFTSGGLHIGWDATRANLPLSLKAETNALFYQRKADLVGTETNETLIRTRIEAAGNINPDQRVGLDLSMDNAFYSVGTIASVSSTDESSGSEASVDTDLESHTDIFLNPYYLYTAGTDHKFSLRVGVHVDLALGYGTAVRVAPDITLDYRFARYATLSLRATGGKHMNDFRQLEALGPYGQILTTPEATYEPLNASIGVQTSPVDGFYLHFFCGYQMLRDDLVEGDYSALTGSGYANYFYAQNTRNAYAGAKVAYSYRDLFTFEASAIYRSWDSDWDDDSTDDPALAYKPQLEAQVEVGLCPVAALHLGLGYRHQTRPKVNDVKADDICNLYFHATYDLMNWVSIYIRANNLLNQTYACYRDYAAPGFTLLGGLAFKF